MAFVFLGIHFLSAPARLRFRVPYFVSVWRLGRETADHGVYPYWYLGRN